MFQILVVENDEAAARLMGAVLTRSGYGVLRAVDKKEALTAMDAADVDLIVLDVATPETDGYALTERLRNAGDITPILMITESQLPEEQCGGFLAGTDDYVVKPVGEAELLLRIRALLLRAGAAGEHRLRVGKVTLDCDGLTVWREGEGQTLPRKEFYLLYKLLSCPNKIFTRLQLMDEIWGMESTSADTTVNVHINRLRKRFDGWPEFKIVAVRGVGYKAVVVRP